MDLVQKAIWASSRQVNIKAVYVGNEALAFCRNGCRAIIDSSSSHITVPTEALDRWIGRSDRQVMPMMQEKLAVTAAKGWLSETLAGSSGVVLGSCGSKALEMRTGEDFRR